MPQVTAESLESGLADALARLLADPSHIHSVVSEANGQIRDSAPLVDREVRDVETEIRSRHAQREAVYRLLADTGLSAQEQQELMLRVVELADQIRKLEEKRAQLAERASQCSVEPITLEQVAAVLDRLPAILVDDAEAFRMLVAELRVHHNLQIRAHDRYEFSFRMDFPVDGQEGRSGPSVPLEMRGRHGTPPEGLDEWVAREQKDGRECGCGCGAQLTIRRKHRSAGIPTFLPGHHGGDMRRIVSEWRARGYLTIAEAAERLGVGQTTLRRAEGRGQIHPKYVDVGRKYPMRMYLAQTIAQLRRADVLA